LLRRNLSGFNGFGSINNMFGIIDTDYFERLYERNADSEVFIFDIDI
jgi:hypothetical protein